MHISQLTDKSLLVSHCILQPRLVSSGRQAASISSTPTLGDHHTLVLVLIGDHTLVVHVQDADRVQFDGDATCTRHALRPVSVHDGLDDGVFGRRAVVQRMRASSGTLVRLQRSSVRLKNQTISFPLFHAFHSVDEKTCLVPKLNTLDFSFHVLFVRNTIHTL